MKLRNKHTLKICVAAAMLAISSCILAGCSSTPSSSSQTAQTMNQEEKVFHYGTTAYTYDKMVLILMLDMQAGLPFVTVSEKLYFVLPRVWNWSHG